MAGAGAGRQFPLQRGRLSVGVAPKDGTTIGMFARGLATQPLVMDFAKNASDKRVLELIFARQEMAYPIVAPGVPADRVRTLRQAFDAVVRDPEYLADARRQSLDPDPVNGAGVAALMDETLYATLSTL
jgi:hypothetical protein